MQRPPVVATAAAPTRPAADEAELRLRIAGRPPGGAADLQQLAALLARSGRPGEAAEAYERAIAAGASALALAMPQALALSEAGRAEEAVRVAAAARARKPRDYALANLLGVLLKRAGRLEEAIPVLDAARRLDPRSISPWQNLGNVYDALGRGREATDAFAGGLRIAPRDPTLLRLHGRALRGCGELPEALASLEKAFALDPRPGRDLLADLVGVLLDLGQADRAAERIARAREANPAGAAFHDLMEGLLHLRTGAIERGRALLERSIAADPRDPYPHLLLARSHGDGDRRAANEALRRGLAETSGSALLAGELVESLSRSRYGDEAAHLEEAHALARRMQAEGRTRHEHLRSLRTVFQRCLDLDRLDATGTLAELAPRWVAEGALSALHYELGNVRTLEDRLRIVEWHRDWGRRQSARIRPVAPLPMPALDTGRPIRVGFMSSDLRDHPVSYFALPVLDLYDRDRFEVYCYSFYERARDRVQAHIERRVNGFRWWPRVPEAEAAARIAGDGLDILFELGGTTAMNKLAVMAHRPARIGASWLGYPHSAGFEQIDCILTDPYIRPEDPRLLIERRPFEMPESWVTLGDLGFHGSVPVEEGLPEERRGHLTFGTMNNTYKYNRAGLDAWAACLRAVPNSRFLFVRPEGRAPSFVANARAEFAARGMGPERVEFLGVRGDHLRHYNSIDIALDTFPHTGGTTTCETLWMGVPVVAMIGPAFAERISYSNLSNAGLGELAVRTPEDYVATAVALAGDRARRRALRTGLRRMIRERPLGQVDRYVRAFYGRVAEVVRQ